VDLYKAAAEARDTGGDLGRHDLCCARVDAHRSGRPCDRGQAAASAASSPGRAGVLAAEPMAIKVMPPDDESPAVTESRSLRRATT
jgi:hypothetical protein